MNELLHRRKGNLRERKKGKKVNQITASYPWSDFCEQKQSFTPCVVLFNFFRWMSVCLTSCKYESGEHFNCKRRFPYNRFFGWIVGFPFTVRRVTKRFGMKEVGEDEDWTLFWTDCSVALERCMEMKRYQVGSWVEIISNSKAATLLDFTGQLLQGVHVLGSCTMNTCRSFSLHLLLWHFVLNSIWPKPFFFVQVYCCAVLLGE